MCMLYVAIIKRFPMLNNAEILNTMMSQISQIRSITIQYILVKSNNNEGQYVIMIHDYFGHKENYIFMKIK